MVFWNKVLHSDRNEGTVINFVEKELSFRNFKKNLDFLARQEINKLEGRSSFEIRHLARRALQRRGVNYSLVS